MSAALFELAVHFGMELYPGDLERRKKFVNWYIENHKITSQRIVFEPKPFNELSIKQPL